jgi:polyisoprenyl-phosphate glycosyltransferase
MNKQKYIGISIISPVFQSEEILDELVLRIKQVLSSINLVYEIILVDDGSSDNSWSKIEKISQFDDRIKGIKLSKNFGQSYAISAGLKECKGKCAVVMDCDLQDNPRYIIDLLEKFNTGYDIVLTTAVKRKHNLFKNLTSFIYYRLLNILSSDKKVKFFQHNTLSLISRKVINSYVQIKDYHRHYLSILKWLGYKSCNISITHDYRFKGQSSYSVNKMLKLALDGIISQTDRLLMISIYIGFTFTLLGFISIIFIFVKYFTDGFQTGWASTSTLIIFSTGLILSSLGVVGIYIGKIFEQSKNRPIYIIEKTINI